jgi:hypothetical protein
MVCSRCGHYAASVVPACPCRACSSVTAAVCESSRLTWGATSVQVVLLLVHALRHSPAGELAPAADVAVISDCEGNGAAAVGRSTMPRPLCELPLPPVFAHLLDVAAGSHALSRQRHCRELHSLACHTLACCSVLGCEHTMTLLQVRLPGLAAARVLHACACVACMCSRCARRLTERCVQLCSRPSLPAWLRAGFLAAACHCAIGAVIRSKTHDAAISATNHVIYSCAHSSDATATLRAFLSSAAAASTAPGQVDLWSMVLLQVRHCTVAAQAGGARWPRWPWQGA